MKARMFPLAAASVAVLVAAAFAADAAKIDLEGVKCVVNAKGDAKAASSAEYKGGKVFFCCNNCPKAFAADSKKFAVTANHQLAATKQAKQVKCPLTGNPLNESQTVKVANVEVAFCCANCKGKVAGTEGKDQLELVFSDKAFDKGFKVGEEKEEK